MEVQCAPCHVGTSQDLGNGGGFIAALVEDHSGGFENDPPGPLRALLLGHGIPLLLFSCPRLKCTDE